MEYLNLIDTSNVELEKFCEGFNDYGSLKNSTWTIDRVSAIRNFQYNKISKHLNDYIKLQFDAKTKKKNKVETKVKVIEDTGNDGSKTLPTVGIFVSSSFSKTITKVILVSINDQDNNDNNKDDEGNDEEGNVFKSYDMIISQGHFSTIKLIFKWLGKNFDCRISSFPLPPLAIYGLVSLWIENTINEEGQVNNNSNKRFKGSRTREPKIQMKPLELVYSLESLLSGNIDNDGNRVGEDTTNTDLTTLSIKFDPDSVLSIMKYVMEKQQTQQQQKKSDLIFDAIKDHFQHFFKFSLSSCSLVHVSYNDAMLGVNGKLKIFSNPFRILKDISTYFQGS